MGRAIILLNIVIALGLVLWAMFSFSAGTAWTFYAVVICGLIGGVTAVYQLMFREAPAPPNVRGALELCVASALMIAIAGYLTAALAGLILVGIPSYLSDEFSSQLSCRFDDNPCDP